MKTLFSADPFSAPVLGGPRLDRGAGCVLLGTETHPSDHDTLFGRSIEKYEKQGWRIVRHETGRIFYDGTVDETREANLWACPPDYGAAMEAERGAFLGEATLAGAGPSNARSSSRRRRPFEDSTVIFPTSPKPGDLEGTQVKVVLGQVPGHPGIHWGIYNGKYVRWPDCDPRYDASCPYPTQIITEKPGLGQIGVVGGFGGPGNFGGGPGGLVGRVAGNPSPGSGPISGPSIPCGPDGYGPSCPPPSPSTTVMQRIYPIQNMMDLRGSDNRAAHGRKPWAHPYAPCPPGYFRSAPGSPCVKEGDLEDYGQGYFQPRPW